MLVGGLICLCFGGYGLRGEENEQNFFQFIIIPVGVLTQLPLNVSIQLKHGFFLA
jgi:hypothetical protein